jgi:hypothetical protein
MHTRCFRYSALFAVLALLPALQGWAYPEFQTYVQENSGRNVNCALCHAHGDGPEGLKPGQIGSLSAAELLQLNKARAAFEPGEEVDSPILNEFGNHIVATLGKKEFLLLRQDPAKLPEALGNEHDIDEDGIPDSEEYVSGTHPVEPQHGDPWRLFAINLRRRAFHVVMIILATVLGLYGLNNLLHGFAQVLDRAEASQSKEQ